MKYSRPMLKEEDLVKRDPIDVFDEWLLDAKNANPDSEANACALATTRC